VTKMKALSAVIILSTAIATPVFAKDHGRAYDQQNFRSSYDQLKGPSSAAPLTIEEQRNLEDFGMSGKDPSRVGGESPWLSPSGS